MERKAAVMRALFGGNGDKCKYCRHLISHKPGDRRYYKCELYGLSCGEATDWKISERACGMMNQDVDLDTWQPIIDRLKHMPREKTPEEVPEEQIRFEF